MGPHEPYWRTNTSFSPPPSRWDVRFQSEELPYDLNDGSLFYGSSTSSNSKESRWIRRNHPYNHRYSASDGTGVFLSSPDNLSQGPQWTPPAIQEITVDGYELGTRRGHVLGQFPSTPTMEGTSADPDSGASGSSHSDSSEPELAFKSCLSSRHNFSSRRSFLSKPIHPLSFPSQMPREAFDRTVAGHSEFDGAVQQRDARRWSSASSTDFADVPETFEFEVFGRPCIQSDGYKCGLCERFLSQRSPWSSRRIVRSGDMPVAGVLSCCHVFHAECLEQMTPKAHKSDPPCPLCDRLEEENSLEHRVFPRLRNSFSRLKPYSEDGQSRPWTCMQMGDCVDGALHPPPPPRNAMLLLNRNRMRKSLSLKGNSSKEFPGKSKNSGSYSTQMLSGKSDDPEAVGCSMATPGPSTKR